MTKQRKLILQIINASCDHPTAEEIYNRALAEMPGMVLATVYNNLNALVAAGQIIRLHTADGADRYDRAEHPHGHLVCDRCGSIRDVELPQNFVTHASRRWGVSPGLLEVSGHVLCANCAARADDTDA